MWHHFARDAAVWLATGFALASMTPASASTTTTDHSADAIHASVIDVRPIVFDPTASESNLPVLPGDVGAEPLPREQNSTVIPLPPAVWTGMASLAGLGLIRGRKQLRRLFT